MVIGQLADGGKMLLHSRHKLGVLASEFRRPWLGMEARSAYRDAIAAQRQLFGGSHVDDSVDAFRHAYGSGLLKLRLMRDRGLDQSKADSIVLRLGRAHEADGLQNPNPLSSEMDRINNDRGAVLLGDGKRANGAWIGEQQLRTRMVRAMNRGELVRVDGTPPALVPTGSVV